MENFPENSFKIYHSELLEYFLVIDRCWVDEKLNILKSNGEDEQVKIDKVIEEVEEEFIFD